VSAPPCIVILINLLFGNETFLFKTFWFKTLFYLYFNSWGWERKEKFIKKLLRKEKISESQQGICSKKQMGKQTYALTSGGLYDNGQASLFFWGLVR
jgi:hypothetical protein